MIGNRIVAMASDARQEFRRGTIILAVLSALRREQHGYPLRKMLAGHGLEVDEGTLYPLLKRLEGKGILKGRWGKSAGRVRRVYSLSPKGTAYLGLLTREWKHSNAMLEGLLEEARPRE